jgi:hypothetical protein
MQLGTRWNVGEPAPAQLPGSVHAAILAVEDRLTGIDTAQWRWTLTWLESRPHLELDDGTTIRYDTATDTAVVEDPT